MTTAYTSLLGLALPVTGELSGTWGDTVNDSITSLLDTSVAGTTNISTDANVTLTTTTGAANQARQAILLFSGARTAVRTVTAPAQSKIYTVINATTGGFAVTLVGAGPTTGVTIANGARTVVAWNGSDFVEVSSPSSIILPGGTANGVLYLNGSKVVTSGSALTFDGTNLGIGAATPLKPLDISFAGTSGARRFLVSYDDSVITIKGANASNDPEALRITGDNIRFNTGTSGSGSEQMRLTSTGLGIGTSSPSAKLDVQGANLDTNAFRFTSTTGTNASAGRFVNTGGNAYVGLDNSTGSRISGSSGAGYALNLWHEGAYPILFGTNNAERMRLDSSGNLGLGVTPSAWGGTRKVLQLKNGYALNSVDAGTLYGTLSVNYYNDGAGDKFIGSGYAVRYEQNSGGAHSWSVSTASGTAGNAITFTQAMTLNASGQLLVGTTSAAGSERLNIVGGTGIRVNEDGVGTKILTIRSDYAGLGPAINVTTTDPLIFLTANTERARINSSGNLLVGTTSAYASSKVTVSTAGSNGIANVQTSSGGYCFISNALSNGGTFYHASFEENATQRGSITSNGTVTAYNTSSDYRLKNITGALTGYKERLMSLQPKQGTWVVDGSEFRGFLAHEFANPYRASVTGEKDAVDDDGKPIYQGMQASSSEVMADLVAMVNELITENASLKARLDAANL